MRKKINDNKILDYVFTSSEASILWGLESSTVKKACQSDTIYCRKSGRSWLVTDKSMNDRFGKILDRIVKGKHKNPVEGLLRLYTLNEIDIVDIKFKLPLPPKIRMDTIDKIQDIDDVDCE
ncbi:MAG: helix-turn-helix domain-containing protein [Tissierellales bacterium]|nr:helix-turn-helix domain-containing protein [Tissierellales bacterium]